MSCTVTVTKHGFRLINTYITDPASDTVLRHTTLADAPGSTTNLAGLHLSVPVLPRIWLALQCYESRCNCGCPGSMKLRVQHPLGAAAYATGRGKFKAA
jgi:hypothetical protein